MNCEIVGSAGRDALEERLTNMKEIILVLSRSICLPVALVVDIC